MRFTGVGKLLQQVRKIIFVECYQCAFFTDRVQVAERRSTLHSPCPKQTLRRILHYTNNVGMLRRNSRQPRAATVYLTVRPARPIFYPGFFSIRFLHLASLMILMLASIHVGPIRLRVPHLNPPRFRKLFFISSALTTSSKRKRRRNKTPTGNCSEIINPKCSLPCAKYRPINGSKSRARCA